MMAGFQKAAGLYLLDRFVFDFVFCDWLLNNLADLPRAVQTLAADLEDIPWTIRLTFCCLRWMSREKKQDE